MNPAKAVNNGKRHPHTSVIEVLRNQAFSSDAQLQVLIKYTLSLLVLEYLLISHQIHEGLILRAWSEFNVALKHATISDLFIEGKPLGGLRLCTEAVIY